MTQLYTPHDGRERRARNRPDAGVLDQPDAAQMAELAKRVRDSIEGDVELAIIGSYGVDLAAKSGRIVHFRPQMAKEGRVWILPARLLKL